MEERCGRGGPRRLNRQRNGLGFDQERTMNEQAGNTMGVEEKQEKVSDSL